MLSGRLHVGRVGIQPVHDAGIAGSQGGGESSLSTADVNDQSAPNACIGEDTPGDVRSRCGGGQAGHDDDKKNHLSSHFTLLLRRYWEFPGVVP